MNLSNAIRSKSVRKTSSLRWLLALPTAVFLCACDSGHDRSPTPFSPTDPVPVPPVTATQPIASGVTEITGIVYRVETDGVFHVRGQRVAVPPDVAVTKPLVDGSYVTVRGSLTGGVFHATELVVLGDGPSYQLDGQIEAIDTSSRTLRLLGIELSASGALPAGFGIGQWVSVRAHRNRFVQSISGQFGTFVRNSAAEGAWFKDVSPPFAFSLDSVVDFTVQVFPTTHFFLTYRLADGDCYGADPISGDEFWQRAREARPMQGPLGPTAVYAVGRFEGGMIIASEVWLCYP